MPALRLLCAVFALAVLANSQSITERVQSAYDYEQFSEAVRLATEAAEHTAELDLLHGLALAKLNRLDEAEAVFLQAIRRHADDGRFALELAGIAYRKQHPDAAKRWLGQALHRDPENSYGNDFLATLFLLEHNLPAALKYWNRVDKPLLQSVRYDPPLSLNTTLRERAVLLSGGQVLTLDRLRSTEANLYRLNVLSSLQFDVTPSSNDRFDLTMHAVEKGQLMRGFPGNILSFARGLPIQTVFADFTNLNHEAINVDLLVRWHSERRRASAFVNGPVRRNPRLTYRLGMDARDETWDLRRTYFGTSGGLNDLGLRKVAGGGELTYGLTPKIQWTAGLWAARRVFQKADTNPVFANSWSVELKNTIARRLWEVPEHRWHADGYAGLRVGRVLATTPSRYAIVEAGVDSRWLPLSQGEDFVVEVSTRIANAFGSLPFDQLFMLGMERDNDLWLRGHVGSLGGRKGNAPLGTRYALIQTGFERTVFKVPFLRVQVGPFFDTGTAADPSGAFGSQGWLADAGVEARLRLFGAIEWRFVLGRNLRDGGGVFYAAPR